MNIEAEIQQLIAEYVKKIEEKEDDVAGLQRNINGILSLAKQELKQVIASLEKKFDAHEISEEQYLVQMRAEKEVTLKRTKEKMNALLAQYEKMYSALESS